MSRALIAKQKIKVGIILRLQDALGDLLLLYKCKINPDIIITISKNSMKYPCINSNQIVVLNKCLKQGSIGLRGFGIFNILYKNMRIINIKSYIIIPS